MGCLITILFAMATYLIVGLIVWIASAMFSFAFSWLTVLGVTAIIILLKLIF